MFGNVQRKFPSNFRDNSTYSLACRVERLLVPAQPMNIVDRIVDVEKMLLDVGKVVGQNQQRLTQLQGSVNTLNENVRVVNANVRVVDAKVERVLRALTSRTSNPIAKH